MDKVTDEMRNTWDQYIEMIEQQASGKLNEWEAIFIQSITIRRASGADLTIMQSCKLRSIYDDVMGGVIG